MNKTLHPNYTIVHELIETAKHDSLKDLPAASEHILTGMPAFDHSLDQILSARQSTRFFDQEKAISYEHLMRILENNKEFQRNNWFEDFEEGTSIGQYVLARRLEKDPEFKNDRIYEYSGQELIPLNDICLTEIIDEIFLQKEFSQAAAIIIFVGKVERAVQLYGPRGYNRLLKKSGAIAEYSWLHTIDLGYVGTVFAGILPSGLRKISDLDGYRKCQMFAFALGHPIQQLERR
jgi:hypothetical protein